MLYILMWRREIAKQRWIILDFKDSLSKSVDPSTSNSGKEYSNMVLTKIIFIEAFLMYPIPKK